MYQKFVIDSDGTLIFGHVYLHRDLLGSHGGSTPHGGGLWKVDDRRGAVLLYGRSFDFGRPDFSAVRSIDWQSLGLKPLPLFYLPRWPDESCMVPVG